MIEKLYLVRSSEVSEDYDDDEIDNDATNYWCEDKDKFKTQLDKIDAAMYLEASWKYLVTKETPTSE